MALPGEVDPDLVPFFWAGAWMLFPHLDMFGPAIVYAVGLEALGYPPTWVDTTQEADLVEAAIWRHLGVNRDGV